MTTGDEMAIFGASEAVFNERSFDQDFRVESDNISHLLFVDAGNDRIGINNSSPDCRLAVNGGLNTTQATFSSVTSRGLALKTASRGGQNDGVAIVDAQDTDGTGGRLELHAGGTETARFET